MLRARRVLDAARSCCVSGVALSLARVLYFQRLDELEGDTTTISVQISNGNSINTSVPGSQLFTNAAGSAFGALQDLYTALTTNTNIGAAVTGVSSAIAQVGVQRVFHGNALNQLNLSENFLNQDTINLSSQENTLVGVDPAKAATDLAQAQVADQATINATGRILSLPTLLDFLQPPP